MLDPRWDLIWIQIVWKGHYNSLQNFSLAGKEITLLNMPDLLTI